MGQEIKKTRLVGEPGQVLQMSATGLGIPLRQVTAGAQKGSARITKNPLWAGLLALIDAYFLRAPFAAVRLPLPPSPIAFAMAERSAA